MSNVSLFKSGDTPIVNSSVSLLDRYKTLKQFQIQLDGLSQAKAAISSAQTRLNNISQLLLQMFRVTASVPNGDRSGSLDAMLQLLVKEVYSQLVPSNSAIFNLLSGSYGLYVSLGSSSKTSQGMVLPTIDVAQMLSSGLLNGISVGTSDLAQSSMMRLGSLSGVLSNGQANLNASSRSIDLQISKIKAKIDLIQSPIDQTGAMNSNSNTPPSVTLNLSGPKL
jgi:hypothetical protein